MAPSRDEHARSHFVKSAMEPFSHAVSQKGSSSQVEPSVRLSFTIMGLADSGHQLISTSRTLQIQLAGACAHSNATPLGPLPPAPAPSTQTPGPTWLGPSGKPSSDPPFRPAGHGTFISQLTRVFNQEPHTPDHDSSDTASEAAKSSQQRRLARVTWASLPFLASSSDPWSGEKASVSYLLYEAEQDELEAAKQKEREREIKRRLREQQQSELLKAQAGEEQATAQQRPLATQAADMEVPCCSTTSYRRHALKPWTWFTSRRRSRTQRDTSLDVLPTFGTQGERKLWETFHSFDQDGNGSIDRHELQHAFTRLGLPCTRDFVNEVMDEYDTNKSGSIDFEEFKHCVRKREQMTEKAFRSIDTDGNGKISITELHNVLSKANLPCRSEREVERMVGMLDVNKDKSISYEEFRQFVCLLPASQASSPNHMLYAWANSSLWLDQDLTMAHQVSSPDEPFQRLLVGGTAGVISRTIIAPIERLRTLMMLSHEPAGFLQSCRNMWADGGFIGLWKGHMSTVIKVFPCSAIQFGVVESVKKLIMRYKGPEGQVTQFECFLAGCLAGGVACIVSHPLDTIRTQMTAATGKTSMLKVASTVGLAGLYRGFNLSLWLEVLGSGIGFLTVDVGSKMYKKLNDGHTPSPQERGLIAAIGASVVMTCVMPLDVVVKRLQVQGCPGHPVLYASAMDAFRKIAKEEGIGAFYRGMLTTYLKTAPSMGAIYFFYDRFSHMLGIGGLNRYRLTV